MSTESKKCEKQRGTITNHNQGSRWARENSIKHIIVKIIQFQPKFLHKRHNNGKGLSLGYLLPYLAALKSSLW